MPPGSNGFRLIVTHKEQPIMAGTPSHPKIWRINARPSSAPLLRRVVCLLALELLAAASVRPGFATDLGYKLMSPSFGGTDTAPYTYAQYEFTQKQAASAAAAAQVTAAKAAAAAAAASAAGSSPAQQFADSIVSQLQSLVARNVALQIANAQPGQAGSIQSNGTSITYVNSDGQLTVNITTSAGTTSFSVPSIN
jgi:hypothetical protein